MRRARSVVLLISLGCDSGESALKPAPIQPSSGVPATPTPVFSLSGTVTDTAFGPLTGSTVEVVDGPNARTFASTDEFGKFRLPGTYSGSVTLRASKEGYIPETWTGPLLPLPVPAPPNLGVSSHFTLQPLGPSADVTGEYTLTLNAASACTSLPDTARQRTYTVRIAKGFRATQFVGTLSGARFVPGLFSPQLAVDVAGDHANVSLGIVEQLGDSTYLAIEGSVHATVIPSGIMAPLNAYFVHCPSEPIRTSGDYYACPAGTQGIDCATTQHQLALVRR